MNLRIKKLISSFANNKIDALLVTKSINISYLADFPSSDSWLLISPKKIFYITDQRYVLEVKNKTRGINVKCYDNSIIKTMFEIAKTLKIKKLGFESNHITISQFEKLKKECSQNISLIKTNSIPECLREVKEESEILMIKKALKVHKKVHIYLKRIIKPKLSEYEILNKLDRFVKAEKAGFSFDPIIASGKNSCYPHAKITGRKIGKNDLVLVDMGIDVNGYKSDLTRMFFLGRISNLVYNINKIVKEAQLRSISVIKEGIRADLVDKQARNYLQKQGLAKYFNHALGHGIGLEVHENPRISTRNNSLLRSGMVATIEPAVYIPNKFGIRIEDMVLIKKKNCEVLSDDIN